jgi:hypothetical protein
MCTAIRSIFSTCLHSELLKIRCAANRSHSVKTCASLRKETCSRPGFCRTCEAYFKPYDINDSKALYLTYKYTHGILGPIHPSQVPFQALFNYTLVFVPFQPVSRKHGGEDTLYPKVAREIDEYHGIALSDNFDECLRTLHVAENEWSLSQGWDSIPISKPLPPIPLQVGKSGKNLRRQPARSIPPCPGPPPYRPLPPLPTS